MIMILAMALAGATPPAPSEIPQSEEIKQSPREDCSHKIKLVTGEKAFGFFWEGPAEKEEALMLLAVDKRVAECPLLVTFDGTVREPIKRSEPKTGLQPVSPD